MGRSWRRGPRWREVMGRALGERPRPRSRARAPDTAQMTMSLRWRPAQQLQRRQGRGSTALDRTGWDEWGGWRRLSLRSSARRDARRERGACLPRESSCRGLSGMTCARAVACPSTPDAGSGRAFLSPGLERPPPARTGHSKRTRAPDLTPSRGHQHRPPVHLPRQGKGVPC